MNGKIIARLQSYEDPNFFSKNLIQIDTDFLNVIPHNVWLDSILTNNVIFLKDNKITPKRFEKFASLFKLKQKDQIPEIINSIDFNKFKISAVYPSFLIDIDKEYNESNVDFYLNEIDKIFPNTKDIISVYKTASNHMRFELLVERNGSPIELNYYDTISLESNLKQIYDLLEKISTIPDIDKISTLSQKWYHPYSFVKSKLLKALNEHGIEYCINNNIGQTEIKRLSNYCYDIHKKTIRETKHYLIDKKITPKITQRVILQHLIENNLPLDEFKRITKDPTIDLIVEKYNEMKNNETSFELIQLKLDLIPSDSNFLFLHSLKNEKVERYCIDTKTLPLHHDIIYTENEVYFRKLLMKPIKEKPVIRPKQSKPKIKKLNNKQNINKIEAKIIPFEKSEFSNDILIKYQTIKENLVIDKLQELQTSQNIFENIQIHKPLRAVIHMATIINPNNYNQDISLILERSEYTQDEIQTIINKIIPNHFNFQTFNKKIFEMSINKYYKLATNQKPLLKPYKKQEQRKYYKYTDIVSKMFQIVKDKPTSIKQIVNLIQDNFDINVSYTTINKVIKILEEYKYIKVIDLGKQGKENIIKFKYYKSSESINNFIQFFMQIQNQYKKDTFNNLFILPQYLIKENRGLISSLELLKFSLNSEYIIGLENILLELYKIIKMNSLEQLKYFNLQFLKDDIPIQLKNFIKFTLSYNLKLYSKELLQFKSGNNLNPILVKVIINTFIDLLGNHSLKLFNRSFLNRINLEHNDYIVKNGLNIFDFVYLTYKTLSINYIKIKIALMKFNIVKKIVNVTNNDDIMFNLLFNKGSPLLL